MVMVQIQWKVISCICEFKVDFPDWCVAVFQALIQEASLLGPTWTNTASFLSSLWLNSTITGLSSVLQTVQGKRL